MFIIFDLDGTLIDTMDVHKKSFRNAMLEKGFSIDPEFEDFLDARPTKSKVSLINKKYNTNFCIDEIYAIKQKYTDGMFDEIWFDSSLCDILLELGKAHDLFLASNARTAFIHQIIERFNISEVFGDNILGGDMIPKELVKPNPYIFNMSMKIKQYAPEETIIFEDSSIGIEAAKASGAKVIQTDARNVAADIIENFSLNH